MPVAHVLQLKIFFSYFSPHFILSKYYAKKEKYKKVPFLELSYTFQTV
ncbi:hypothetical protein CU036_1943 [Enterococcus faecium]|nr:hypothetical protein [Enterococcus faecium]